MAANRFNPLAVGTRAAAVLGALSGAAPLPRSATLELRIQRPNEPRRAGVPLDAAMTLDAGVPQQPRQTSRRPRP
jgi:hypothetical protein